MRLSDSIERFIKDMMAEEAREVELKRNELAEYFNCAPSQINYVLSTRFSPSNGYQVESRRGGGGYIRIVRIVESGSSHLAQHLLENIGPAITEESALRAVLLLAEQGIISERELLIMRSSLTTQALSVPMPDAMKDILRAKILRNQLLSVIRAEQNGLTRHSTEGEDDAL